MPAQAQKRAATNQPVRKIEVTRTTIKVANGRIIVEPKSIAFKAGAAQEAEWKCPDGTVEIRFVSRQTPFRGTNFRAPQNAAVRSGIIDAKTKRGSYRYAVIVTTKDNILFSQEQEVVVV